MTTAENIVKSLVTFNSVLDKITKAIPKMDNTDFILLCFSSSQVNIDIPKIVKEYPNILYKYDYSYPELETYVTAILTSRSTDIEAELLDMFVLKELAPINEIHSLGMIYKKYNKLINVVSTKNKLELYYRDLMYVQHDSVLVYRTQPWSLISHAPHSTDDNKEDV